MDFGSRAHAPRLLLAAVAALAGCGRSASPVTSAPVAPLAVVTGTVSDTSGAILAGAIVTLQDSHGAPAPAAARRAAALALRHGVLQTATDAQGRYAFEPVAAGDYLLTGSAAGHATRELPLAIVTEGDPNVPDTLTVDVVLTPG